MFCETPGAYTFELPTSGGGRLVDVLFPLSGRLPSANASRFPNRTPRPVMGYLTPAGYLWSAEQVRGVLTM